MKKRFSAILAVTVLLLSLAVLSACGVIGGNGGSNSGTDEHEHSFTDYVSNNDAACTTDGTETAKCNGCEETVTRYKPGSALGHELTAHAAKEPTCTRVGYESYESCSRCGYTTYSEIPALGHDFSKIAYNETSHWSECIHCGEEGKAESHTIGANGLCSCGFGCEHEVGVAATCTSQAVCSKCGKSYGEYAEHTPETIPAKDATCTEPGYTSYEKCTVCKELLTEQEVITELGHSFTNYVSDGNATCTEDGTKTAICDGCTETDTVDDLGSATGHSYGEPTFTWSEDHTSATADFTCENDPAHTETVAATVTSEVTKAPTAAETGTKTYTATVTLGGTTYSDTKDEIIPELGTPEDTGTKGLIYTASSDGKSYSVTDYTGTATDVVIPEKYQNLPVTSIGRGAFEDRSSLTSITIPDSVTSIGQGAFEGCSGLESITLPFVGENATGTRYTHFGYIFGASSYYLNDDYVPSSLKTVVITRGTSIGNYAFRDCSGLTSITIPNSVTSIGDYAFSDCSSLTSITIPDSVTDIGKGAFSNCSSLTSITIPDEVTSIDYNAFYSCSGLESITLPFVGENATGTGYTHFGYIFGASSDYLNDDYVPSSLKTVVITRGTSIGNYAFKGCSRLTSITIPDSVTSIGDSAFYNCRSLTSITIPDSVTSIGISAFSYCSGLESITIPDSVTSIGISVFFYCSGLESITIPDSVTSIGDHAFYGCSGLTSITIPDSVTGIGDVAFYNCYNLTSITIPDSVTGIGWGAFDGCDSLASVVFENTDGWWVSTSSTATRGTSVDVTDASRNATYLRNTYSRYYWKRSE